MSISRARLRANSVLFRTGLVVALALAIGLALTACSGGGGSASGGGGQNVTVTASDSLKFDPSTITVKAGQPVNLTLDNSNGALVHDFSITSNGQNVSITAQPHSKANGTFTLPAGTYQFYCNQPGHKDAGMVGTITAS